MKSSDRAVIGLVGLAFLCTVCQFSIGEAFPESSKLPVHFHVQQVAGAFNTFWQEKLPRQLEQENNPGVVFSNSCITGWINLANTTDTLIRALDAFGKPGAGILDGNFYAYGSYDECFATGRTIYCLAPLVLLNTTVPVTLETAMCLPSQCGVEDIEAAIDEINSMLIIFNVQIGLADVSQVVCERSRRPPYNAGAIIMIMLSCLFALMAVFGTATDWLVMKYREQKYRELQRARAPDQITEQSTTVEAGKDLSESQKTPLLGTASTVTKRRNVLTLCLNLITAFSLLKTVPTVLSTKQTPSAITSLNGMRVISMFWVILGHTHFWILLIRPDNITILFSDVVRRFSFQVIVNGFFAVDSFFFLSGFLVSYLTLREMQRKKGRFPLVVYYVHRYLRLTPTYAFCLFFIWLLTMHLADGPIYNTATGVNSGWYQNCVKYWWTNLFYINNFYPWEEIKECISWTWYLANDMQFYIVAPLMIILLYHSLPVGLIVVSIFLSGSFAITGAIAGHYGWPANTFSPDNSAKQSDYIYIKPWARISPYIVGIVLGYVLFKNYRLPFHRSIKLVIYGSFWTLAAFFGLSTVYGFYGTFHGHPFSAAENVLYFMFSRFAWGIALAFVVYACHTGYGGIVNYFLSMQFWIPLSRLTFTAYLIHPVILTVMFASLRSPLHYTDITMAAYAVSAVVLSYGAAAVITVFVEFPLSNVETVVFKALGLGSRDSARKVTQARVEQPTPENTEKLKHPIETHTINE